MWDANIWSDEARMHGGMAAKVEEVGWWEVGLGWVR
jgi:hypothetical protein